MANVKHAVVRIDGMAGTKNPVYLKHVMFYGADDNVAEIDNAQIVVLGEKEGREVYKATAPTGTSTVGDLYLVAGVELFYDESVTHYLTEWVNEAGKAVRAYKMVAGADAFGATAEAFDGEPAVGKFVGFKAGSTKLVVKEAKDAATFGEIKEKETIGWGKGAYTYFLIDVCEPAV